MNPNLFLLLALAEPPDDQASDTSSVSDETRRALEAELTRELANDSAPLPDLPPPGPSATIRLIDISFDLLVAGGGGTPVESELRDLEGGGHDPKNHGFTFQNGELSLAGVVDPYVRGDVHLVVQIDEEGETVFELEEAFLTTLSLPAHLQLKAGQFLTAFGRLNGIHPHAWDFTDQPFVLTRLLGPDAVRGPGAQLSWLTPLPFFFELTGAVANGIGETATSFRGVAGEEVAGRVNGERPVDGLDDLLYSIRAVSSLDVTDELSVVLGGSGLFGPNATSESARTVVAGADLLFKWRSLANDKGWPFVAWQSEFLFRRYRAAAIDAQIDAVSSVRAVDPEDVDDFGGYSQLLLGFARPWVFGLRYEHGEGTDVAFDLNSEFGVDRAYYTAADPARARRDRFSAVLSYYPTEFSKVRVQYNHDETETIAGGSADSAFLQGEITFGAHGAHTF